MKEHFTHVAFREPVGGFHGNQAALNGALLHALVINAAPIVLNFNVNVIATMIRAQGDSSSVGLACCRAVGAVLDSMGYRVAYEMDEGIGNLLNDVVVQFGLA